MTNGSKSISSKIHEYFSKVLPYFEWMAAIAAIVAAIALCRSWIDNLNQNKLLKQIDVEMHCNQRWGDLFKQRLEIEKMPKDQIKVPTIAQALDKMPKDQTNVQEIAPDVEEYYRQFWSLQSDQFYYYMEDFLPEIVYLDWMHERVKEFEHNVIVGGVSFHDGWANVGRDSSLPSQGFIDFVDKLITLEKSHRRDYQFIDGKIREILHEYREQYRERFKKSNTR